MAALLRRLMVTRFSTPANSLRSSARRRATDRSTPLGLAVAMGRANRRFVRAAGSGRAFAGQRGLEFSLDDLARRISGQHRRLNADVGGDLEGGQTLGDEGFQRVR